MKFDKVVYCFVQKHKITRIAQGCQPWAWISTLHSVSVKEKGHVNKLYGSLARSTQYFHYNLSLAKPKKVRNRSGPSFSDCHRESNRHFRCWELKFHYWQKSPATKHADWTRCAFSAYARGRENTETADTDRSKCHFCCLFMLVLRALLTRPFSCKGFGSTSLFVVGDLSTIFSVQKGP